MTDKIKTSDELKVGDKVIHVEGAFKSSQTIQSLKTVNDNTYACYVGGGFWLLSRLTKDIS